MSILEDKPRNKVETIRVESSNRVLGYLAFLRKVVPPGLVLHLAEGKALGAATLVGKLETWLTEDTGRLLGAWIDERTTLAEKKAFYTVRMEAVKEGRIVLMELRNSVDDNYGAEVAKGLGFGGRTPIQPCVLAERLRGFYEIMSGPGFAFPRPRPDGVALEPTYCASLLDAALEWLDDASNDYEKATGAFERARMARILATVEYNETFKNVVAVTRSICRLLGLDALAQRLRPSTRRPGVLASVEARSRRL